jgi:lipoate-protein ligase A
MSPAHAAPLLPIAPWEADEPLVTATRADGIGRVLVSRPADIAVVLGRSGRPDAELHLERCLADGVALRRRRGGGCAVVLDPGNVVVAATARAPGLHIADHFAHLSSWLVETRLAEHLDPPRL